MSNSNDVSESYVAKYLKQVREMQPNSKGKIIFRGQANSSWNVMSSAGRRLDKAGKQKQNEYIRYHVNLIANARKNGYNKLEAGSTLSDLEVLAEIQHYGGATCLTDFTTNFLVALWFASQEHVEKEIIITKNDKGKCEHEERKTNTKGRIFWLDLGDDTNFNNISYYNRYKEGDTIEHLLTKRAQNFELKKIVEPRFWVWEPTKLNNRIIKQDSVFLFGLSAFSNDRLSFHDIEIEEEDKIGLRKELEEFFGIYVETVFHDLTGYSNDANAPDMAISEKLLSSKQCLECAKRYIKKEQYKIALSYVNDGITCKKGNNICKNGNNKKCDVLLGEFLYWNGEINEGLNDDNVALLNYHEATFELGKKLKNKELQEIIYPFLCESFRKQSILYYKKQEYNKAKIADQNLVSILHQTNNWEEDSNGIDSLFALLELSIFTFSKVDYESYKNQIEVKKINSANGKLLLKYLNILGDIVFNSSEINLESSLKKIDFKINNSIPKLIGYLYWDYLDTITWIQNICEKEKTMREENPLKKFVVKNSSELTLLAQKAHEIQENLHNKAFTKRLSFKN